MEKEEQEKKKPVFIQYVEERVMKKNKNFIILFVGQTGSGKSYSALRLAEMLDPTFTVDRCCFKAKDFMQTINDLIKRGEQGEQLKGKVVLWDEFGVEHNAREFMTISNRVINYFFQTSRHLNLVVIMTVPLLSFIDSATRKLIHGIAEMQGINQRDKTATVRIKMNQTNVMTSKEYPKYLRYNKGGKTYVPKTYKFAMPSEELRVPYEAKRKEFTTWLNKDIMGKLLASEQKEMKKLKPLTEKQEGFVELMKNNNVDNVSKVLGISTKNGYDYKKACEEKGIVFKAIRKDNNIVGHDIEGFKGI
jgi:ABC-type dipeptide/oligopeptide/nickel transport system ATPase component|tara:strand:+ start:1377 stop:2291 length:915 start_codon:yes stop_codon:yes gene_type:complete